MKILNVIKCEFIKNYTFIKILLSLMLLMIASVIMVENSMYSEIYMTNVDKILNDENYTIFDQEEMFKDNLLYDDFKNHHKNNAIEKYKALENKIGKSWRTGIWQQSLTRQIIELEDLVFVIDQLLNNPKSSFDSVMEEVDRYIEHDYSVNGYIKALGMIKIQGKDLEELKEEYSKEIDNGESILEENKFYKYIEYQLDRFKSLENTNQLFLQSQFKITEELVPYYEKIVEMKLEDEFDYRVENIYQLASLEEEQEIIPMEEWMTFGESKTRSYESYLRPVSFRNSMLKKYREILSYSVENELKNDLQNTYVVPISTYKNTKHATNQILTLSCVVLFIVILTSGGIISQEHFYKTDKIQLTSPIKRWKVFLGKFLYLIAHTYFVWLVAFIIIFLYSGIRFGFNDLFTPELIYRNGSVIKVNYIIYMLKMIFVNGLPVIAIVSILLMLSTVTLKTSFSVGVTSIFSILSIYIWMLIYNFHLLFLVYTPIPYINLIDIQVPNGFYFYTLELINANQSLGLLVSIITIIICYGISNFIYVRRDIKN